MKLVKKRRFRSGRQVPTQRTQLTEAYAQFAYDVVSMVSNMIITRLSEYNHACSIIIYYVVTRGLLNIFFIFHINLGGLILASLFF